MSEPLPVLAGVHPASREDTAGRLLPVAPVMQKVLPWPGLRRGATIAVSSVSLLFTLLAPVTAAGGWAAVVGMPGLSAVAAAEAGVVVERMPLVPRPGEALGAVVDALVDGMDVVAVAGLAGLRPQEIRKITARARQRGTVLMSVHTKDSWPGADVELRLARGRWCGLGAGHGHVVAREVEVRASGRGAAARPRSTSVLLPGPGGPIAESTSGRVRGAAVVGSGCA